MMNLEIVGYIAALFSTLAMLPQALQVWRTGKVEQLSLAAFSMATLGALLWIAYGLLTKTTVIVVANVVGGVIVGSIALKKALWLWKRSHLESISAFFNRKL